VVLSSIARRPSALRYGPSPRLVAADATPPVVGVRVEDEGRVVEKEEVEEEEEAEEDSDGDPLDPEDLRGEGEEGKENDEKDQQRMTEAHDDGRAVGRGKTQLFLAPEPRKPSRRVISEEPRVRFGETLYLSLCLRKSSFLLLSRRSGPCVGSVFHDPWNSFVGG